MSYPSICDYGLLQWGWPNGSLLSPPKLSTEEAALAVKIKRGLAYSMKELLTKETLFNLGLSPTDPKGEKSSSFKVYPLSLCGSFLAPFVEMRLEDRAKLVQNLQHKRKAEDAVGEQKKQRAVEVIQPTPPTTVQTPHWCQLPC